MRSLLLACAATLTGVGGLGLFDSAMAQTASPSDQSVSPLDQTVSPPAPIVSPPAQPVSPPAQTGSGATPGYDISPGEITVRLNGRVNWYAGVEASSLDNNRITGVKTSTTDFLGYLRLYPGFDGVASNGLHYGAAAEIRMNSGEEADEETLFVFQAYGYLGLPKYGQISFGQENGPATIFETGTFEGFNDGGWNGDIEGMIPTVANPVYPYPDSNPQNDQGTDKIVYLSPTFKGFQFALSFEPNFVAENNGPVPVSLPTPTVGIPRNQIDIGAQYTKNFGPVGVQIGADWRTAGTVGFNGTEPQTAPTNFHDLNILGGGATITVAGLTVGGSTYFGSYNLGDGDLEEAEPDGGTTAVAWMLGATYTVGPLIVGGNFFRTTLTGDIPGGIDPGSGATITSAGLTTGQQQNDGVAAGATYTLVPGVSLFLDYLYGVREQGGFDFQSGLAGNENNRIQSQLFGFGSQIQW
jgi:predicted porin